MGLALGWGPSAALAQAISFSDATFNPWDWPMTVLAAPNPPSTGTAVQVFGGIPHPGFYQKITHVLGGTPTPSRVTTIHLHASAVYTPRVQGAIQSIDHSEVAATLSTEAGTYGAGTGAALRQNGLLYVSSTLVPTRDDPNGPLPSPLKQVQLAGLSAGNFGRVLGPGMFDFSQNPDFSATGSPIEFGFARNSSHTASSPVTRVTAIRSWAVVVTPVAIAPPVITLHPQSITVNAGAIATFTSSAAGSGATQFQWSWNGVLLPGATTASLSLTNVQPTQAGNYAVTVSNPGGSVTSATALLTVLTAAPPVIVSSPSSRDVRAGTDVQFCVTASGSAPLRYQWRKNGLPIIGATGTCLALTGVQIPDAGIYTVEVANSAGWVVSQAARLGVTNINSRAARVIPSPVAAGVAFAVSIDVVPEAGVLVFAVEDQPPQGWTVTNITHGGTWDRINAKVKWGPFFDDQARTLGFAVTPPASATGTGTFTGKASFDGISVPLAGSQTTLVTTTLPRIAIRLVGNDVIIEFSGGQLVVADTATGPFTVVPGATSPYRVPVTGPMRFYSVR